MAARSLVLSCTRRCASVTSQRARARVVLVEAKKNSKKKNRGDVGVAADNASDPVPAAAAREEEEVTEVVLVQKQRTAYRQPKKTPEERAAEREQQRAELHEARQISPEAAQHNATRVPGRRVTLVDGYNIIGSWPMLAGLPTLQEKRERLEIALAAYVLVNKCYVDVVYDSMKALAPNKDPKPKSQQSTKSKDVIVTYAGKKSADEVLKVNALFWATKGGSVETIVISNDKQVQQDCTQPDLHMMALGTPWLIDKCQRAEHKLRQQARRKAEEAVRQPEDVRRVLRVRSLEEALQLPEERLRAAGLTVDKLMQLMMRGI